MSGSDALFVVDEANHERLLKERPWLQNSTYFKKVKVSGAAAMKMVTHASAGVDKGLKSQNGMPVEVMGLMTGHLDTEEKGCIIVTDVRRGRAYATLNCYDDCRTRGNIINRPPARHV